MEVKSQTLRAIWAKYQWNEYLEDKDRKKETEDLWVGVPMVDRLKVIKQAYGR